MAFVPAYGWFASRVDRVKLLTGVTLFFIACIETFAVAIAARVPYVGVAFFIWVGIFNMSLVAQFWAFASDIYSEEAGNRLFPVIVIGMTGGAPLGSLVAGRLFRLGIEPQVILQVSAVLLFVSMALYLWIAKRATREGGNAAKLEATGGFSLVLGNSRLRQIALLVVLLNIVNTTGEYLIARLLSAHVADLALADPTFNKQAFIGAFAADYQFWVNVLAFGLQTIVASRLVKYAGLAGALLALPVIALGGYSLIAVGLGFSVVRFVKIAENATDYSLMNTARQLLWLPMTREEKYKAKQAIDTFFVRSGDVLSAGVVYLGTQMLKLNPQEFAFGNVVLTLAWIGVALHLAGVAPMALPRVAFRRLATGMAALLVLALSTKPALAQETRQAQQAAERAEKAARVHPYEPDALERRLEMVDRALSSNRPVYLAMGGSLEGSGIALGPGYRMRYGDTGAFDAQATWSIRNYVAAKGRLLLPAFAGNRVKVDVHGNWLNAPAVDYYGVGSESVERHRSSFEYHSQAMGAAGRVKVAETSPLTFGASLDAIQDTASRPGGPALATVDPTYRRTAVNVQFDSRTAADYSRSGSLARVEWADFHETGAGRYSFRQTEAEVQQFVPLMRENWVLAFRALATTTDTADDQTVPYFRLPALGGNTMLRGFASWRFRDRNRMLLSGEHRWTTGPFMDMAVFVDAGKVTARLSDLNFRELELSEGIGLRIHTPSSTVTRLEVARSREGFRYFLSFSPSF